MVGSLLVPSQYFSAPPLVFLGPECADQLSEELNPLFLQMLPDRIAGRLSL